MRVMSTVRCLRPVIKPYLPSAQLADVLVKMAARADGESMETIAARAGVPSRVITRWRLGESGGNVDLNLVDLVLTRMGLFWWEVWTEDTVREPLFVVTTYSNLRKKSRHGGCPRRRIKVRTIPYGDLGTDFWRLREIETLMNGQFEVAA